MVVKNLRRYFENLTSSQHTHDRTETDFLKYWTQYWKNWLFSSSLVNLHLKHQKHFKIIDLYRGMFKISLSFILKLLFVGKGNNLYCIVGITGTRWFISVNLLVEFDGSFLKATLLIFRFSFLGYSQISGFSS